jgi:hypothetical protein
MKVRHQDFTTYAIDGLSVDDLRGIREMITGAKLPERQMFNGLLEEINEVL